MRDEQDPKPARARKAPPARDLAAEQIAALTAERDELRARLDALLAARGGPSETHEQYRARKLRATTVLK